MYTLKLSEEERQTLIDVLECYLVELHSEIMHTDRRDLKDCLKGRKQMLLNIVETLKQESPVQNP
jgi:hypothetical protein